VHFDERYNFEAARSDCLASYQYARAEPYKLEQTFIYRRLFSLNRKFLVLKNATNKGILYPRTEKQLR